MTHRKNVMHLLLTVFLVFGFLTACLKPKVERMEVEEVKDLSGWWNDTDSRLVSEEMIQDCLARPWVDAFQKKKGRVPEVIVGNVVNKSYEHINTETFVKDLERSLINSGKVSFVANKGERVGVRQEREDQGVHSTEDTRKAPGKEVGADYMLIGTINSILDQGKKEQVVFYQVELEAVDMADNRKVWIGQKKLKKYVKRPKAKI